MRYAVVDGVDRSEPQPGFHGLCPICENEVLAKCGQVMTWHWSHIAGEREDCDTWYESLTAWHLRWQNFAPVDRREVIMPPNHRADIFTHDKYVVEVQHSAISVEEIQDREQFYGQMAWIFDVTEAYAEKRFRLKRLPFNLVSFAWLRARKSLSVVTKPLLLDLGEFVVFVDEISFDGTCKGRGQLIPVTDVAMWLSGQRDFRWLADNLAANVARIRENERQLQWIAARAAEAERKRAAEAERERAAEIERQRRLRDAALATEWQRKTAQERQQAAQREREAAVRRVLTGQPESARITAKLLQALQCKECGNPVPSRLERDKRLCFTCQGRRFRESVLNGAYYHDAS